MNIKLKVPEKCLICNSKWIGGCQIPGQPFPKKGRRVFYECGSSISIIDEQQITEEELEEDEEKDTYCYKLKIKNCNA